LAQADLANRGRGEAGFDAARVGLATTAAFSFCGFRVAFGFAGAAGVIVARAAIFATVLAVRMGFFSTGLGRCVDR